MRYLGMSLGYGVALGICAVCGTLIPPIFKGEFFGLLQSRPGLLTLAGIGVCVVGIVLSALAGLHKEREMSDTAKKASVQEFNFKKGVIVALFCGVLSACMAFALDAASPLAELSALAGTPRLWTGLPKLVVILFGGFTSNALWCVALNIRNRTGGEYIGSRSVDGLSVPRLANVLFCALAGVTWYFQFFFYTMGETQMGRFSFSSWTLHMASIIIFSTLWGVALKEWKGASRRAHALIAAGLAALVLSTLIIGYGNYLAAHTV
jgi:L-rhamnose-H+ transport protein